MEYPITYPGFQQQRLSVKTAGIFWGRAKLLLNGKPVKRLSMLAISKPPAGQKVQIKSIFLRMRTEYLVKNDIGADVKIALVGEQIIDPVPRVEIGKSTIQLVKPFTWYEYLWLGWPMILVVGTTAFGLIPALFAGLTMSINTRLIFRRRRSALARYGLTALVTIGMFAVCIVLTTIILIIAEQHKPGITATH